MNVDIRKALQNSVASFMAYCQGAVFKKNPSQPAVNANAINASLESNNRNNIPVCFPYGFISWPLDMTASVVVNQGVGAAEPMIVGQVPILSPEDVVNLQAKGESAIYSVSYTFYASNNGAIYNFKNTNGVFQATAISGENANLIMGDLINAFANLVSWLNNFVTAYNEHQHKVEGVQSGGDIIISDLPSPEQSDYTPPAELQEDLTAIQNGQTLINNNGISPFRASEE